MKHTEGKYLSCLNRLAAAALFCAAVFACTASEKDKTSGGSSFSTSALENFSAHAADGTLAGFIDRHYGLNVKCGTLGGKVWWETLRSGHGWKLQRHRITGLCRILDPDDVRVAWGTAGQLENQLMDRPKSWMANYGDKGYGFSLRKADAGQGRKGSVVLIHGLAVRASAMRTLSERFSSAGYDAYSYDYPTGSDGVMRHGKIFLEKFRDLLKTLPDDEKIFIVTHSMGGIILRAALANADIKECSRISAVVMMAPPNGGSTWADIADLIVPGLEKMNRSFPDLATGPYSPVNLIPPPVKCPPLGIIRGLSDGKVSPEYIAVYSWPYSIAEADCNHFQLRSDMRAFTFALRFCETGNFDK